MPAVEPIFMDATENKEKKEGTVWVEEENKQKH